MGKRNTKKTSETPSVTLSSSSPSSVAASSPRSSDNKLLKRFYEPLVLQHILGNTRGGHISVQPPDGQDESELDNCKLRRSFIDMLAYICDYYKNGGRTVTAIGLEERPEAVVFWVAANRGVSQRVVAFLTAILGNLARSSLHNATASSEEFAIAVEDTFKRAVKFGTQRVKRYWQLMQEPLEKCVKVLDRSDSDQDLQLKAWLMSFPGDNMEELCRFSYETRESPCMKELARRSPKDSISAGTDSHASHFSSVRHYIGRICMHMKAAKTLVATAARPSFFRFFESFQIECCPSQKPAEAPPKNEPMTLDRILIRMLPRDDERVPEYQEALQFMDDKFDVSQRLIKQYQDSSFLPIVHAELIVLEHFHTNAYKFVDGDKYVGCSKPACYCCYHYICAHPGNFVRPASHNKNYLNWRPPDGLGERHQRDILNDMIKKIRNDVLMQIKERRGPHKAHHDSTTGISIL